MAATMATSMALLNPKCFTKSTATTTAVTAAAGKPTKPLLLLSLQTLPKGLTSAAVAGAVFSALSAAEPSFAAQQLAEIADGDNRGLALLLPLIPAIAWVLYNILQPALNQINKMRSSKGLVAGLGLAGGLAAAGLLSPAEASAAEAAAGADNRGQLLLFVVAPAIAWVLYNILQPALNQINRMRSE